MKLEWVVTNVTAVESPDRVGRAISGVILDGHLLANSGRFCAGGAILWCMNPLLSSDNLTQGRLMKTKLLVTDVTAIGPPGRAERTVLGVILAGRVFGQFGTYLWSMSHFVMQEPPLEL